MPSVFNLPDWANSIAGNFFGAAETLAGAKVIDADDAMILKLDPDGSARDVPLPAEGDVAPQGQMYWIVNAAGGAENLVVKNDGGDTIVTISQNESAVVFNAGTSGGTEASWVLICLPQIALS